MKSPHVVVAGAAIRVYCSRECLEGTATEPAAEPIVARPLRRGRRWIVAGVAVAASGVLVSYAATHEPPTGWADVPAPHVQVTGVVAVPTAPATPVIAAAREREYDRALVDQLKHDAWIHPLAGPRRRMPRNHTGAFGASRPGERPPECVSGHCGVDLGRTWGEPVLAVNAGVVEFVQRGPNEERGGMFVRIAHRDGTLFSWYFHLAAVPRWVRRGVEVRAGQVIGVLGDTGIKRSAPHLHFALSVKPSQTARERYLDPEPLIAIWPLWIPDEDGEGGRVTTEQAPGVPVRAPTRRRPKRARNAEAPEPATPPVELEVPAPAPTSAEEPAANRPPI